MLTWCCFLDLAHIQISILQIDPSQTLLDLHFDGPVLDLFQITIFLSILIYGFIQVRNLLFEFINLKSRVVEITVNLLELGCYFIQLLSQRINHILFVV